MHLHKTRNQSNQIKSTSVVNSLHAELLEGRHGRGEARVLCFVGVLGACVSIQSIAAVPNDHTPEARQIKRALT